MRTTATLLSILILARPVSALADQACMPDKIIPHFDKGTTIPKVFNIGENDNKNICRIAEGSSISRLKFGLRRENIHFKSPTFWAVKCDKLDARQTIQPDLMQIAIWKNNLDLIEDILVELDMMDDLNFTIVNELGFRETHLDWLDRQIQPAHADAKTRLREIRHNLITEFNAKTLDELKASGMCVAPNNAGVK